ncbi:MAG TPA: hypothetical protein VMY76_02140 [Gemmatimonadales bacterium]|nr:hypothetical protein [Gemmatimonadales bacterium]
MPPFVLVCPLTALALGGCAGDPTAPTSRSGAHDVAISALVDATVATVKTQPDSLLIILGDATTLKATVLNQAGEALARTVSWNVQSPNLVSIVSKNGSSISLKARKQGTTTVKATADGKFGSTKLVIRAATGAKVILTPASASVAPKSTTQFSVSGRTSAGETATVSATWTATGGTVSNTGIYTAGTVPGTYRVIAKAPFGAADTSVVTIAPPAATSLVLVPGAATVETGGSLQFFAYGRTGTGDSVAVTSAFSATGGTVSAAGLYAAGSAAGTFQVIAATAAGLADTSDVSITQPTVGGGIPYGLWGMTGRKLVDPYTSVMQPAQPDTILVDLAAARARGARIMVNFAGGSSTNIVDSAGHFDYAKWKARVDRFLPIAAQLNSYVADGTLLAFLMIDEPLASNQWGGQSVPLATLDQMGQYSKSIFPDLATAIRTAPSQLQNYTWQYLDISWAQYTARKGPISQFVSTEVAAAAAKGLGLVMGLNIAKGGDGSSTVGTTDNWMMSQAEILTYGHAMLDQPAACAFISWDNRASVIDRPEIASALQELAGAAGTHASTPCRR